MTHAETLSFTTETSQLLKLMIHSLYSNREIFLRELVSNASDALDKLRFEGYSDGTLLDGGGELRIEIECDPAAHTVTVRDNGIGMSREEVIAAARGQFAVQRLEPPLDHRSLDVDRQGTLEAKDVTSALSLVGRSIDVMIDANQKAQLATLAPPVRSRNRSSRSQP